jgi:hypothetical protein
MRIELEVDSTTGEARIISKLAQDKAPAAEFVPVYVNGHLFTTQAELNDYLARVQARDANLAQWKADFLARQDVVEPGKIDVRTFNDDDAMFWWTFALELFPYVTPQGAMHRLDTWIDTGTPDKLPEFPLLDNTGRRLFYREGWNWQDYHGPLRAILEKHRGGPL